MSVSCHQWLSTKELLYSLCLCSIHPSILLRELVAVTQHMPKLPPRMVFDMYAGNYKHTPFLFEWQVQLGHDCSESVSGGFTCTCETPSAAAQVQAHKDAPKAAAGLRCFCSVTCKIKYQSFIWVPSHHHHRLFADLNRREMCQPQSRGCYAGAPFGQRATGRSHLSSSALPNWLLSFIEGWSGY